MTGHHLAGGMIGLIRGAIDDTRDNLNIVVANIAGMRSAKGGAVAR